MEQGRARVQLWLRVIPGPAVLAPSSKSLWPNSRTSVSHESLRAHTRAACKCFAFSRSCAESILVEVNCRCAGRAKRSTHAQTSTKRVQYGPDHHASTLRLQMGVPDGGLRHRLRDPVAGRRRRRDADRDAASRHVARHPRGRQRHL